ncbi:hypothetical protein GF340_04955 [Candidatus Peregrinibacteria bacterium]|nr:hypothetical protein [Candidatus Peregrinibacteria bacterium]
MEIIWRGNTCVEIKNKKNTVLINPYKETPDYKLDKLNTDILVLTGNQPGADNKDIVDVKSRIIDWPGEYEINGILLNAYQLINGENKGFFLTLSDENLKICYMEDIGDDLNDELIESIGDVDILIIPVGGKDKMNAKIAHKVMEEIEPRCVIPMMYQVDRKPADLETAEAFLKTAGAVQAEPVDKYEISGRSSLKDDKTEFVLLNPKTN